MMANSFSGKTVARQPDIAKRASMAVGLIGLGLGLLPAPAQADTVIISTSGFAIGTPGFFLSVGNPVAFYPSVVSCPSPIYFPSYFLFQHPYPVYQPGYSTSIYPPLAIDDAIPTQVQPNPVIVTAPTVVTNSTYTLTGGYLTRDSGMERAHTESTLPWVEVQDLSTTPGETPAASPSLQSSSEADTYRISTPDPFNQSVRSLEP